SVPGQRLVHRVVDDLPQAVHEAARVRGADVHAGTLADGVQAFEDRQMACGVVGGGQAGSLGGPTVTAGTGAPSAPAEPPLARLIALALPRRTQRPLPGGLAAKRHERDVVGLLAEAEGLVNVAPRGSGVQLH